MRTVWIISEGSLGHISQSVGLADALKEGIPLDVQTIECRLRLNGVARSLVRAWMGNRGRPLPRWALEKLLHVQPMPPPDARPDLILSSGGKSVIAARSLAAAIGVPYVFLGERKPYRSEWFHTVFTPSAAECGANDVQIEMIPTQISRVSVERAAAEWSGRPAGRLWAMIIGGASVSHWYADADWDALAAGMNQLATAHGIRWLVTTSRRTGADVERRLRAKLAPDSLAKAIWWAENPEKKVAACLGSAETVFVTQDSVTMVTEAVASARPVFVLRPDHVEFSPDSFLPGYFENLERHRRVRRVAMQAMREVTVVTGEFQPREQPIEREIASVLIKGLNWR